MLQDWVVKGLAGDKPVPLRIVFKEGGEQRLSEHPTVTLTVDSPAHLNRLLRQGGIDRLAGAYVEGEIEVDGRLQEVLRIGQAIASRSGQGLAVPIIGAIVRRLLGLTHTRRRDANAIRYHYDVSNEFYRLWLDRNMVYSCAYFCDGAEDIHAAQEQKLDHICRKLRLQPGDALLDIGCGWGGLIVWAAQHYGVRALGVTLSAQQCAFAQERVAAQGLSGAVEVRVLDYRDIPGEGVYDKIASVGMFEHVGLNRLTTYFGTIHRLLKEGGLVLNHGITTLDIHDWRQAMHRGFIDDYVFPEGELPHISRVLHEMGGRALETLDVENLRPHYAQTLIHWVHRLKENRDQAIGLVGLKRYRVWSLYMAGCALAFEQGRIALHQVLAAKKTQPGLVPTPWERRYQYQPGDWPDARIEWGEI